VEFETLFKVIVAIAATVAIPVAAYAAVAATRTIWGRPAEPEPGSMGRLSEEIEALKARVGPLEAAEQRVLELEERLDFAERLLAQQRDPSRLGPGEQR
jgi:hypothetical protein